MESTYVGHAGAISHSAGSKCREIPSGTPSPFRRLRILTFLEGRTISGAVKPVLELAREAAMHVDSNLELITVAYTRESGRNALEDAVRQLGIPLELVRERGPWDIRILPRLRAIVAYWQPDIIWTHNCKSHFLVRLLSLHHRAKWIATHHGYTSEALRTLAYNQLDRWSLRAAHRVVTDCHAFTSQLASRIAPSQHMHVQHNPIRAIGLKRDPSLLNLRSQLRIPDDTRIVLTIGRLSSEKGHADLLRALLERRSRYPRIALIVLGDGPERQRLAALLSEAKLDDTVHFVGFQEDVQSYLSAADLFVLPSRSEGSPNVLLEALDAGVPVVATAVGGVPEIVEDGVSALLVPARQPVALASAIDRALADGTLRHQLVTAGRRVLAKHSPEEYFRQMSVLFEESCETS